MALTLYLLFFIFVIGCCIGSFLNVVILRAFSGESIVLPPSKCPLCNTKLKWYHNIPVLSYIFLRGKCAFCGAKISPQYPIVELSTAFLFIFCAIKFGFNILSLLFSWYFVSIFIVLAVCDIKEKVIFDFHSYFLVAGGLLLNYFNIWDIAIGEKIISIGSLSINIENSFIYSLLGIVLAIVIMEGLARLGCLLAGTRAFGEGDTYIAAGLGAIFGYKLFLPILIYAFIIQVVLTIPIYVKKLINQKDMKTLVSLVLFCLLLILLIAIQKYSALLNLYFAFLILLIITAFYLCKRLISNIKNASDSNLTFLPFGPALVLGAMYLMFSM